MISNEMRAIGLVLIAALAACGDDPVGGTGGAGGIQDAETASGNGGASTGSSSAGGCEESVHAAPLCAYVEANCEPDPKRDCLEDIHENRCTFPQCTAAYDTLLGCLRLVVDEGAAICTSQPPECQDEEDAYDACDDAASKSCGNGPNVAAYCAAAQPCFLDQEEDCFESDALQRCVKGPACVDRYDAWQACVVALAENDEWFNCPEDPMSCDDLWESFIDCPPGGP